MKKESRGFRRQAGGEGGRQGVKEPGSFKEGVGSRECNDQCFFFQSVIGFYANRLSRQDGEVGPNPGWPTMTGASRRTRRKDATLANGDGN